MAKPPQHKNLNPKSERGHSMSTTNTSTTTRTTKTAEEKVAIKDAKILQLQNEKKKILQQQRGKDRKERTSRLCRRHGLIEKFMPDLINITEEQFEAFVRTWMNTNNGRSKLAEIISKGAEASAAYIAKCRGEDEERAKAEESEAQHANDNSSSAKPPKAEQSGA